MMRNFSGTIAARLGPQAMAIDPVAAHPMLFSPWPDSAVEAGRDMVASTDLRVERGQRHVEVRGLAVMPLRGLLTPNSDMLERYLGWATFQGIEAVADEMAARDDISALVVDTDSPGGLVIGGQTAVQAIARLAAVKPVYALVNPMAASMAYFIISQATEIIITPGGECGSIGTVRTSVWPVQPDMGGDQWSIHVSAHARAKMPDPTTERGRAEIQRSLDEAEGEFLAGVVAGRRIAPEDLPGRLSVTADAADGGAMFRAQDAIARGLADRIETRAAFYERVFAAHAPQPKKPAVARMGLTAQAAAAQALANI